MKYYTVYETVNKETGKAYRGYHKTENPYDGYLGSGTYFKRALKKYGVDKFEKFVLYVFDNKEDMVKKEAELVNAEYLRTACTYNLKRGGEGGWDYLNDGSEKHRKNKLKAGYAGHAKFKENCGDDYADVMKKLYKLGLAKWVKSDDPEIMALRSEKSGNNFRGRHHTNETKDKQRIYHIGKHVGENNCNYGKCWIYSDIENKSISIKKEDLQTWLDKGWIKGRKIKF